MLNPPSQSSKTNRKCSHMKPFVSRSSRKSVMHLFGRDDWQNLAHFADLHLISRTVLNWAKEPMCPVKHLCRHAYWQEPSIWPFQQSKPKGPWRAVPSHGIWRSMQPIPAVRFQPLTLTFINEALQNVHRTRVILREQGKDYFKSGTAKHAFKLPLVGSGWFESDTMRIYAL